jgi:hypothetical protein
MLNDDLKQVLKDDFKTDLLYKTRNQELDSRFQKVLDLMQEVEKLAEKNPKLASIQEILLLKRFLSEQADYDKEQDKWLPKVCKDVSSGSLQSAYDADATYRDKAGKNHSGYVLNISETCAKENPVQFITDYTLQPNNASDVNIAKERLPKIKENTDVTDIYVDGGYYGEEVLEKAQELEINLHYTDMTGRKAPKDKLPTTCFTFDDEMKVLSCPEGKTPLRSDYDSKKKVSSSHFSHDDCKGCPVFDICPVKTQKKTRVLRVSSKTIFADQTREQILNKNIKRENTSRRAAIEGTNSALKRGEDADKLDVRGKVKCRLASGCKVIARNVKQFTRFAQSKFKKPKQDPIPGVMCPNPS